MVYCLLRKTDIWIVGPRPKFKRLGESLKFDILHKNDQYSPYYKMSETDFLQFQYVSRDTWSNFAVKKNSSFIKDGFLK